jgi:uncharacterized delta-60 repeat protein
MVILDPNNNKILVAGSVTGDMRIWRYDSAGKLDSSFGTGGVLQKDDGSGTGATGVVVTASGKLLVSTGNNVYLYDTNGQTLDSGFEAKKPNPAIGGRMAVDQSNRITILGSDSSGFIKGFSITRLLSDGSIDNTFGVNGVVTNTGGGNISANGLTADPSGNIYVAGSDWNYAKGNLDLMVWKFRSSDGELDSSFGTGGVVQYNGGDNITGNNRTIYPRDESGSAIKIDPQGKVLVSGNSVAADTIYNTTVWRFNQDGSLDTTFGANKDGVARYSPTVSGSYAQGLTIDSSGRILLAGRIDSSKRMTIWRYSKGGVLDTTFGDNGIAQYKSLYGSNAYSIFTQNDDLLITGFIGTSNVEINTAVWKYKIF